jgi:hypothetical protein
MDKKGEAIYVRLPMSLEAKLRDRARKSGRPLSQQIVIDLATAQHLSEFSIEQIIQNFFEIEGKKC